MKEITVTIDNAEFVVDIEKAKSLGVLKEVAAIKDFKVGDVFVTDTVGNAVIIVSAGYSNRYSIAGLYGGLNVFSDFGAQGATREEILKFLNSKSQGCIRKFVKNINEDFSLLLAKVLKDHAQDEAQKALQEGGDCEYDG